MTDFSIFAVGQIKITNEITGTMYSNFLIIRNVNSYRIIKYSSYCNKVYLT